MTLARIEELARKMRVAIESIPRVQLPPAMSDFPNAACGDAALLLGNYLIDHGVDGFVYVVGNRGVKCRNTWISHAWLQRDTLVVDITADQFPDAPGPIVVAAPSPWHEQFRVEETYAADFRAWYGPGTDALRRLYGTLQFSHVDPRTQ